MNALTALKRLHKKFPKFDIDTLFEIMDCITEEEKENNLSKKGLSEWGFGLNPYEPEITPTYCTDDINNTDRRFAKL